MPVTGPFSELAALGRQMRRIGTEGVKRVSKQLALEARQLVAEGFQRGVSPSGQAWAPLTVRSGQPLRDTGTLASSITIQDAGAGFAIGTSLAYAEVHQRGGTVRAKKARSLYSSKARRFFGKVVVIPARPFLPEGEALPAAWEVRLNEAAEEAIEAFFG